MSSEDSWPLFVADEAHRMGAFGMGMQVRYDELRFLSIGLGKTHAVGPVLGSFVPLRGWRKPATPGANERPRYLEFNGDLSPTSFTRRRGEQGALRAHKLAGRTHAPCSLCRAPYPEHRLELAHIKPRPMCTDQEKLDSWNTMLACEQCHSLFDDGLLWVDNSGTVRWKGGFGPGHPLTIWGQYAAGRTCPEYRAETRGFFHTRLRHRRTDH